jgi:adenine-specific DNA-methyltransferase
VELAPMASSWAHFVVHAAAFVRPGGRLAMILPAELAEATYAAPVRDHLLRTFAEVGLVSFGATLFPGTQQKVVLLLASARAMRPVIGRLIVAELDRPEALVDLDGALARASWVRVGGPGARWPTGPAAAPGAAILDRLLGGGKNASLAEREGAPYTQLRSVGSAHIGFVSGANDYFVLTEEEVAAAQLPRASLKQTLLNAKQVGKLEIHPESLARIAPQSQRSWLWQPASAPTPEERAYILRGEAEGVDARYKCRARAPWWKVHGIAVPDAFLTSFVDEVPRISLNRAGLVGGNTLLVVSLPGIPVELRLAFAIAFYNSATLLSCERAGRAYGGGVLRLSPGPMNKVIVPSHRLLREQAAALLALGPQVEAGVMAGGARLTVAIRAVDEVVLRAAGVSMGEMTTLCAAREAARARRRSERKTAVPPAELKASGA